MQKRIISLIVVLCLVGIIVFIFIRLKQSKQTFENSTFETVPQHAVALVDVHEARLFEHYASNDMWNAFSTSPFHAPLLRVAQAVQTAFKNETLLTTFGGNSLLISFMECKDSSQDYIISIPLVSPEQVNQAHELMQVVFGNYNKKRYSFDYKSYIFSFETAENKRLCSYSVFNNTLIISPSHILVEAAITSCHEQQNILGVADFTKIKKTASKQTPANAYIDLSKVTQFFMPHSTPLYGGWTEFDVNVRSNSISLNGFSLSDSTSDFLSIFRGQKPIDLQLSSILPAYTSYFKVWGLSDVTQFHTHYEEFAKQHTHTYTKQLEALNTTFQSNVARDVYSVIDSEIAFVCGTLHNADKSEEHYAILKTISQSQAEEMLTTWLQGYEDAQNDKLSQTVFTLDNKSVYSIYSLPLGSIPATLWNELCTETDFRYVSFVDNYMIFANSNMALTKLITAYELKKVLTNDMEFKKFQHSVLPTFTYYEYVAMGTNGNAHTPIGRIQPEQEATQRCDAVAFQIAVQDGMFYNNMYIRFAQAGSADEKPETTDNIVWESVLDAKIATQPQIFEIQPGEFGILVQDEKNTLYLLNSAGKVQWKKPLHEPLISPLVQVDYFKNGKYQYVANSQNYVYCIDRLGNFVEQYPHKLEEQSTVAMSVFDYEKTKEYRLFVPCGKKLFLYNIKMQKIKDWTWNACESTIVAPVQHFTNAGKDYIVCADQRNVYLLNRKGELRSKANEQFEKSPHTAWYYQPKTQTIVSTDVNASIKALDFEGKVHTLHKDTVAKQHYFLCSPTTSECVIVANQKCTFYTSQAVPIHTHELDFAVEIAPHSIANSPFSVGIVDKSNSLLYICNSKDILTTNTLQGKTEFTSGKLLKNQRKTSIIIGTNGNTITNYQAP
jgi:hypothetical protein